MRPLRALRIATLGLVLAGCAPRPVPVAEVGRDERRLRFERGVAARGRLAHAVEADLTLWVRVPSRRLPGAQARLLVVGPGAFRLRIESLLGTALDVSATGDTVIAYAPGPRLGWTTGSAGDSLGLVEPGRIACRVWSAAFEPPDTAWARSTWRDSLLELEWEEGGGAVRLAIGSNGLPRLAHYESEDAALVAEYGSWRRERGGDWPTRITLRESRRGIEADCRLTMLRFPADLDRGRLVTRMPREARIVSRAEIAEWFEGSGAR